MFFFGIIIFRFDNKKMIIAKQCYQNDSIMFKFNVDFIKNDNLNLKTHVDNLIKLLMTCDSRIMDNLDYQVKHGAFHNFTISYPDIGLFKLDVINPNMNIIKDKKTEYFEWYIYTDFPKNTIGYVHKKISSIDIPHQNDEKIFAKERNGTLLNPYKKIKDTKTIKIKCLECDNWYDSTINNIINNYIPKCDECNDKFKIKNTEISILVKDLTKMLNI